MAGQGTTSKSNGIPPRAHDTRSKKPELADKLQKIDQAANSGNISDAKVESVNAQAQIRKPDPTNGKEAVDPHSKPPFDSQEEQRVPDQPNENNAVEPHDTPMTEATDEDRSEPSANSAAPRSIDETTSEDKGMLVSFRKLSLGNSFYGGVPETWCRSGFSTKAIVRYGPMKAAKYMLKSAKGYNLKTLPEVSDKNSRITQIWDKDENGKRHRRYTVENIEGIVGVVVQEGRDSDRVYKTAPRTYLKIKFIDIAKDDEKNYLSDGCAWVPKSDLDGLFEAEMILDAINEAWDKQEERYHSYENGAGRGSPDRIPSVCPLGVFDREKTYRARSATPKSSLKGINPPPSFKQSPAFMRLGKTERNSPEPYIKQEEAEEESGLFVQQPHTPAAIPRQSNVVDLESTSGPGEKREPLKFNVDSYIAHLRKKEKWNTMSEKEQAKRAAKALANYDHYREERLRIGDIEEEDEEEEKEEEEEEEEEEEY